MPYAIEAIVFEPKWVKNHRSTRLYQIWNDHPKIDEK